MHDNNFWLILSRAQRWAGSPAWRPAPRGHRLWLGSGQIGSFTVELFVFTAWRAADVAPALYFNGVDYGLGAGR